PMKVTSDQTNVDKQPEDLVIGGTVNGSGTFDVEVTHSGKDTVLSQKR
ncbi:12473_t:CDS:1, partial [Funneliformis caledonium]